MFGSVKFLALFLLAVVGGNVLNNYVTWQAIIDGSGQPGLSAGASGGIMGIGAALLVAAFFKMSVNGMVLNLKSLIIIMGINLVYGFAVPGIDNAGHIGGAITGLLIALPIALVYRKRELAQQAAMAQAQQAYQNAVQASYASNHQPSYQTSLHDNQRGNPPLTNIFADNNIQTPVDLNNTADTADFDQSGGYINNYPINNYPTYIDPKKFAPEPVNVSLIWRLLPWLVMVVIVIGFLWWWQDIHQQILQVLKAIE
ncbi:rhomboid family intramembrane serine protease, partial [uncultured Psychrobacter sp.]|uniref:rhomboid family intramembrane serine protease n=1 Tax=uncultured Psychrobacter sp. TaxID=259303 RepID=UPI0032B2C1BD